MGLFSSSAARDPRYVLPKASGRDYYRYQHVGRYEYAMLNLGYFEKSLKQGISPDAVLRSIQDSRDWSPDIDAEAAVWPVVNELMQRIPDVEYSKGLEDIYAQDILFGIYAGIFERFSGQHKNGLRHPAIWNAMSLYGNSLDEENAGLTDDQALVRIATPHLGYTAGIEPWSPARGLFDRWDS